MESSKRGFTLVELMIVVGIIGLLVSIVFASFGTTRTTTKDERIKAAMTQLRLIAQTLRYEDLTYKSGLVTPRTTAACTPDTNVDSEVLMLGDDIKSLNGVTSCAVSSTGVLWINKVGTAYAATARLASGTFWCVDSIGNDKGGYATRAAALTDNNDVVCN